MSQGFLRGRRVAAVLLGACAIALLAVLMTTTSAFALGKPVTVDAGVNLTSSPPSVSVDASGDALIAWNNDQNVTTSGDRVQYCVVQVGTTGCSHSGELAPADAAQFIDGVHTLVDGSTMIVLADVYGAAGNGGPVYTPEQEWQSTDGGATWSLVDNGLSVANGDISGGTGPLGAVVVPGTNMLGFGWDTAFGPPTFNAFPLSNPPECSDSNQQVCAAGFATLQAPTSPANQLGNVTGEFASIPSGTSAGVMGAFDDLSPVGSCPQGGTAYVYGSGAQSATNNYNISPGQPNSAWRLPLSAADCKTASSAVGGGSSGFGILEASGSSVVYHRFDATTERFDTPLTNVDSSGQGELFPAVSQDGAGGIYATYLLTPDGKPLMLAYSADAGQTFSRASLASPGSTSISHATSSVNAAGQGWAVWLENSGSGNNTGSVLAESFQKADAVPPLPPSFVGSPIVHGRRVTLPLTVPLYPAVFSITLTAPETVVTHHRRTTKIVIIARSRFTTRFTSRGGPSDQAGTTVTLNFATTRFDYTAQVSPGAGQAVISAGSGHIKARVAVTESAEGIFRKLTRALVLTLPHRPSRR